MSARAPKILTKTIRLTSSSCTGERIRYAAAAEYLGIPEGTLRCLVSQKRVPHIRLGPRSVVFEKDALDAWLAKYRHGYREVDVTIL